MCPAELVKPLRLPLRSYESSSKLERSDIVELHIMINIGGCQLRARGKATLGPIGPGNGFA